MVHALCLALLALPLALSAQGAPPARPEAAVKPYPFHVRIGDELRVRDLDGREHALFAENEGKALVLVFWSYKDPVSRHYAPILTELARAHAGKLTLLLVDANHDELVSGGDPLAKLRQVLAAEKITLPLFLDRENRLADDFGAIANGQAFLIDGNRFLRYHGGIDDDPDGKRGAQGLEPRRWLARAIEQVLAGEVPKEHWTRPSGRPIKRVPKAEAQAGGGGRKP